MNAKAIWNYEKSDMQEWEIFKDARYGCLEMREGKV